MGASGRLDHAHVRRQRDPEVDDGTTNEDPHQHGPRPPGVWLCQLVHYDGQPRPRHEPQDGLEYDPPPAAQALEPGAESAVQSLRQGIRVVVQSGRVSRPVSLRTQIRRGCIQASAGPLRLAYTTGLVPAFDQSGSSPVVTGAATACCRARCNTARESSARRPPRPLPDRQVHPRYHGWLDCRE